jgi:5'-3' exonuclease
MRFVQVVKIEGHEADDVVATLAGQVLQNGHKVVIASPDKDFKQLISEDVQIVLPIAELNRWSFYTLKHYISQYNCDPCSDLSFSKCENLFLFLLIFDNKKNYEICFMFNIYLV